MVSFLSLDRAGHCNATSHTWIIIMGEGLLHIPQQVRKPYENSDFCFIFHQKHSEPLSIPALQWLAAVITGYLSPERMKGCFSEEYLTIQRMILSLKIVKINFTVISLLKNTSLCRNITEMSCLNFFLLHIIYKPIF